MTRDNITLEALVRGAEPYDPSVGKCGDLMECIEKNPKLKEQLMEELTDSFISRVKEVGKCYFVINNISYKQRIIRTEEIVKVGYCGREESPLISINL